VTPCASRRAGDVTTWYCLSWPPNGFTSMTPGTLRMRGMMSRSSIVRSCMGEWLPVSLRTTKM